MSELGLDEATELDQRVWDGERLRPEVRHTLLSIADKFVEGLDVEGLEPVDVLLVGSIAGYNYRADSDIDLHVLVNAAAVTTHKDMALAYFRAKKVDWNSKHRITVIGRPVELYVQDVGEELNSSAVFSVRGDRWIKRQSPEAMSSVPAPVWNKARRIASRWEERAVAAIQSDRLAGFSSAIETIYGVRKIGLERGGEQDPANLAFKMARSAGVIDALRKARTREEDRRFSLS